MKLIGNIPNTYEFGDFRVDAATLQVFRNGSVLAIPPKAVEVLVVLLNQPGDIVTRATLLNTVWPDTVVEEANLSQYIYLLRKALMVKGGRNTIITVAGRGYRFVEEVRVVSGPRSRSTGQGVVTEARPTTPVLTILPFEMLDKESRAARLGLGVAQSVAQRVVRLRGISVRPVGNQDYSTLTLRGSILVRQGRVRTAAELIDSGDGALRWAETVDENVGDWFSVQDTIADRIALLLAPKLSDEYAMQHGAARQSALSLYLKGRYYWNQRTEHGFQKAIQHYEKAASIDPQFALAYAGLADCYNLMSYYLPVSPRVTGPKAMQAARSAVELDPNLAEGYVSLGRAILENEWNWESAEATFRRALSLNPHYATAYGWYACLLLAENRPTEAMVQMMRAHELDPNSLTLNRDLGFFHYMEGRTREAVTQLEETLEMETTAVLTAIYLASAYASAGSFDKARSVLRQCQKDDPHNARLHCELGCVEAADGHPKRALEIGRQVLRDAETHYVCPFDLAMLYASASDLDSAFQWLRVSLTVRPWRLIYAAVDPRLENLRGDPRFAEILKPLRFRSRSLNELAEME